jgi:hypothetical protein
MKSLIDVRTVHGSQSILEEIEHDATHKGAARQNVTYLSRQVETGKLVDRVGEVLGPAMGGMRMRAWRIASTAGKPHIIASLPRRECKRFCH